MKKVLAICLSALLILVSLPVSMALAENDAKVYASADKTTVCPGSTVAISVVMENNPGIVSWKFTMDYASVFTTTAKQVTKGDIFTGGVTTKGPTKQSPFNMSWNDAANEDGDAMDNGVMYTVLFNVAADAAEGEYTFGLSAKAKDIYNYDLQSVPFAIEGVTVTIGHTFDNACDATCDCGATREVEGHKYDSACDVDCNECGEVRETEGHKYDGECDADCNECGAARETEGHKYTYVCDQICYLCGMLTNPEAKHTIVAVEAVEPTCHDAGNIAYWYCSDCGAAWADEALTQVTNLKSVILPAKGGDVIHVEAIEPGCHYNGQIEHWICYGCDRVWADEDLTQITNTKNIVIPAKGGDVVAHEAVAPGCHYEGNIAYWTCAECEQVWADEALTQLTNIKNVILPELGGDLVHIDAVAPGCHYEGNIEYWYCAECDQVWADEARTQLTNHKNVILPALQNTATHVPAKAATCTENGNVEYWYCEDCQQVWADEALTQLTNIKNVQIAASCAYGAEHHEVIAAGCHYKGQAEYWYCATCDVYYADAACTVVTNAKNIIIPALKDSADYVAAKTPTCTENGNVEYWTCAECEQVWADEALTQLTNIKNVQIAPSCSYNAVYTAAVEAGCHYKGNTEYWYCATCDVYYANAECTIVTNAKNVIIPALQNTATHVEAKAATCTENGNVEYWTCAECEQVWIDEALTQISNIKNVQIAASCSYNAKHTEAVAAGCHYEGNIEYWYCATCDVYYADAACTEVTNAKNVIIPELGGNVVAHAAVEPGCHMTGNIAYWTCTECEQVWADEALTQLTNIKNVVLPAKGGDVVAHAAVEPGCHMTGNIAYWTCAECEQVWQDEALTQLTNLKNVIIPAKGGDVVAHEAVEPGCHYQGNIAYWTCAECEQVWADEALTQLTNLKNVIIPAKGGDVVAHEAVEPGCHMTGNIAYWSCAECEQVWQDEALTQLTNLKNVIIPAKGGDVVAHEAVEPGCHYQGNIAYWTCAECEQVWADEALTQLTNIKNVVLPALKDTATHVEYKAPTATENGNIEYWYCEECEQFWTDEALTQLTNSKNVIIPALGEDATTTTKPEGEGDQPSKPMGENALPVIVCGLIALIAAAGALLFSKKKA